MWPLLNQSKKPPAPASRRFSFVNTLASSEKRQPTQRPQVFLLHPPVPEPPPGTWRGTVVLVLPPGTAKGMGRNQVPPSMRGLCGSRQTEEQPGRGDVFAARGSPATPTTAGLPQGGRLGGPEVTVVARTSKKAVFHSGPASGGAYRGCQGKRRDKMLINLLEILLARLAPKSDYGPSGRPSGRICGCAPSSRAGGPKTASCPLCPPAPLGRQPLATARPSVPAPRRAASPAQGPAAAALWKTPFSPHLRQTKLTSASPRNNLRPPGAFWAVPKGMFNSRRKEPPTQVSGQARGVILH